MHQNYSEMSIGVNETRFFRSYVYISVCSLHKRRSVEKVKVYEYINPISTSVMQWDELLVISKWTQICMIVYITYSNNYIHTDIISTLIWYVVKMCYVFMWIDISLLLTHITKYIINYTHKHTHIYIYSFIAIVYLANKC